MPTIVRGVVNGPSREELFDALRLGKLRLTVSFDLKLPQPLPVPPEHPTEQQIVRMGLEATPLIVVTVTGIKSVKGGEDTWEVTGVLRFDEGRQLPGGPFYVTITHDTKARQNGLASIEWGDSAPLSES